MSPPRLHQPAVFGVAGSKTVEFCSEHRKEGVVNVKDKAYPGCTKRPVYGVTGSKNVD